MGAVIGVVVFAAVAGGLLGMLLAKGHGLALGPLWLTPFRLAHPDSPWARHLYGPEKLALARERYPAETQLADERDQELRDLWGEENAGAQDRITRRALRRARRS